MSDDRWPGVSPALALSLARAAAPVGASLLYTAAGARRGYDAALAVLLLSCLGSVLAVLLAGGRPTPDVTSRPETGHA